MGNDASAEARLAQLGDVLAEYASNSTMSVREEEYTETVEKEVIEEQTITDTETVDRGPHPAGFLVVALGVVLLIALVALGASIGIAITVAAAFILSGGACLVWLRKTEEISTARTKEVPKTVVEEVTKTRTIEEPSTPPRVLRAGSASLRFHVAETPDGSLPTGPDSLTDTVTLDVPTVDRPEVVYDATQSIQDTISEIPWVLDGAASGYALSDNENDDVSTYAEEVSLRGEERALREYFQGVEAAFANLQTIPVRVRALKDPDVFAALEPLMDEADPRDENERDEATDPSQLLDLFAAPYGEKLERFAQSWESTWTRTNLALLEARSESLFEQVGPDCYELGRQVGYAAFNFYCPHCNQEQQDELLNRSYDVHDPDVHEPIRYSDTTRCLYRPEDDVWQCRTCERTSADPIPVHRMLDEILFPAYDHLMQENKNERLRIHARARDQERDLQEKADRQLDEIQRDHLSRILSLSEEMERFEADISGEHDAITSMKSLLKQYGEQQDASVQQIEAYTREVKDAVRDRTQTVLREVDAVKEKEMSAFRQEMDALAKAQRIEDQRRDQLLQAVAQNTERSAAANERTAQASEQQVEEQRKTRKAIDEQSNTIEKGHSALEEQVKKQTATQKAALRKKGTDTDDYSGLTNPLRASRDWAEDLKGTLMGRSQEDIERAKMDNA